MFRIVVNITSENVRATKLVKNNIIGGSRENTIFLKIYDLLPRINVRRFSQTLTTFFK